MLNKVMIIGNLGNDPEIRYTQGGQAVANFNVATNEKWTSKDGKKQERTEWHKVVVWGKQAENCGKYLKKGRTVHVEGKLQTRDWQDKDGNKRYTTEIVAHSVLFLSGDRDTGGGSNNGGGGYNRGNSSGSNDQSFNDDDIPF